MSTNITLIVLLAVVVILLIVYRRARKQKVKAPSVKTGAATTRPAPPQGAQRRAEQASVKPDPPKTGDVTSDGNPQTTEITYSPVPEGVLPKPLSEIDSGVMREVQGKISGVQPIPSNSMKLLDLLNNPFSSWNEIVKVVSTNPMFSARALQAVNSVYFNLPDKVTSVGRAITLLGYNSLRSLVMGDLLEGLKARDKNDTADAYVNAYTHSAVVSACSGYLGRTVFQSSEYDLATIGLFHDIGKYFIAELDPSSGALPKPPLYWLKTMRPRPPLVIQEQIEFGIDHSMLGSLLAEKWQLSEEIRYGIEYHHYPSFVPPENIPDAYVTKSFVVCLSDLICKALGYCMNDAEILPIRPEYYDKFGLDHDPTRLITPGLTKEIANAYFAVRNYIDTT